MYNGYPNQDAFHAAMKAAQPAYLAERAERLAANPRGYVHEACDHANDICMATGADHYSPYAPVSRTLEFKQGQWVGGPDGSVR